MKKEIDEIIKLFQVILNSNNIKEKWQKINSLIESIDNIDEVEKSHISEYLSDLIYELSFYEPDQVSREESYQYYGDKKLKDIFEEFKENMSQ
jgi:predicted RND superfamily exporter protein